MNRTMALAVGAALAAGAGCVDAPSEEKEVPAVVESGQSPTPARTIGEIERLEAAIDQVIPKNAVIEVLAQGFEWAEGPLWVEEGDYLLFSDVPRNRIYLWREGEGHSVWLEPSGYIGELSQNGESGSNGLLLDAAGRLLLCQHGDRRVARMEADLSAPTPDFSTVADRFDGMRFNSPNDAVLHSDGSLYFTDPPYGLAGGADDPERDMDYTGVFRVDPEGGVRLLTKDLSRPNGLAFSPDETILYVANSDPQRAIWMAFEVAADGGLGAGRIFFDATEWVGQRPGLPDGLKVDTAGHLFATGPGGVLVFHPDGRHLGTIATGKPTANCALDDGGRNLYITADDSLLRVRLAL